MALEAINGTASIVGVLNSGVTTVDRSLLSNRNNIQIEALKQLEQGFASRVDAALAKLDVADIATPKIKGLQREQAILTGRKARLTSAIEVTTKSLDQIVFIKSALENLNTRLAEVNAGTLSEADFALIWDNTLRIINMNTENASIAYKDGGISRQQNLISSNSRTSFHASSFLAPYNSQGDTFLISGQYVGSDYFLTENGGTRFWNSNTGFLATEGTRGTLTEFSNQAGFPNSPTSRTESVASISPEIMLVTNVASSLSSSSITAIGGNGGTGTSPSGQEVSKALDNNTATQYTNLDGINSGLVFDLGKLKRADRFTLTTATDKPANDPTSAKIFGSKDGVTFTELSDTEFDAPNARQTDYSFNPLDFGNLEKFQFYKVIFPTVRIPATIADHADSLTNNAFTSVTDIGTTGTSPAGQEVDKAFDSSTSTSFRLNSGAGGGVIINLGSQRVASTLRLTTSASNSGRDPTSFSVFGSNDGTNFTTIATNQALSAPSGRTTAYPDTDFTNFSAFQFYKITFPTVRTGGQALQIGEIGLNSGGDVADHTEGLSTSAFTAIGGNGDVGSSPSNERVHLAFDDNVNSKYLYFDRLNSGALVDFGSARRVNKLGLTTANDAINRDPASFSLFGSNDNSSFTTIVSNRSLSPPTNRNTNYPDVTFTNNNSFRFYKIIFPTIRSFGGANSVQISEIRLAEEATPDDLTSSLSNRFLVRSANGNSDPSSPEGEDISKAFDGSTSTKFTTVGGAGSSVIIDLGSGQLVNKLGLTTSDGNTGSDPTSYSLAGSNDGTNFTSIVSSRSLTAPTSRQTAYTDDTFTDTHSTFFRFYKLTFDAVRTGGSNVSVSEIRLGVEGSDGVHASKIEIGVVDETLDEGQIKFTPTSGSSTTFDITRGGVLLLDAFMYKNFGTANLKKHAQDDINRARGIVLNAEAQFKLDSRTLQSRSVLFDPLISGIKKEIGQITNKDLSEKEAVLKALQLEFQLAKFTFALMRARGNALVKSLVLFQDSKTNGVNQTIKAMGEAILGSTLSVEV